MKVIFFGSSPYVLPIIEQLTKNFNLVLVVTTEKENGAVPKYCNKNTIKYLSVNTLSNVSIHHNMLQTLRAHVAVLADFGLIIPPEIINIFPKGILNIHPSLLPKYRGPTPVQQALLNNDKKTGISIIKLDNELDHGPILFKEDEQILPTDTAQTLYSRLFQKGAQVLPKIITDYVSGNIKLQEQDHKNATYTEKLTRQSGYFDIVSPPSKEKLERMIHAYFPWPGVWTILPICHSGDERSEDSRIDSGEFQNDKKLRIKFLPNKMIQIEGKKPIKYKDFLNGYPQLKRFLQNLL